MKRTSLTLLFAVFLAGLPDPAISAWVTAVVDRLPAGGKGGDGSSIAVDSTGAMHISSINRSVIYALQYTTNASGAWETILLDEAHVFSNTSVAVDSANRVHISYMHVDGLKYATNASGTWVTTFVQRYDLYDFWSLGPYKPYRTSIALDSADKVHISYTQGIDLLGDRYQLRYATNTWGADWWRETVDDELDSPVYWHSIAVEDADKVHISYTGIDGMEYANNTSGGWEAEALDPSSAYASSIVVDGLGDVHIGYVNDYDNGHLYYATNASGEWEMIDLGITDDYSNLSIALDSSESLHIAYTSDGIRHATNLTGTWVTESVGEGSDASLALDGSDKIHVSFSRNDDLNYATNISDLWVTAALASPGNLGDKTSIALDASERAHISYLDDTNGTLKYATNASGAWVVETIGPASIDGSYTSIALDGSGGAHICYLAADSSLGYATKVSGTWTTETVAANGRAVSSIAVDAAGKVHISHAGGEYATNASGSWVTEEFDPSGGWGTSIALDGANKAHICYRATGDAYSFMYATNASGAWATEILDQSWGESCSIAVDSSDKVHIAYSDKDLAHMYATNISGVWMTETVEPELSIRMDPSIALDTSDKVHMSYRHETCLLYPYCSNPVVKYATNASGQWRSWVASDAVGYGDDNAIAVGGTGTVYISHHDFGEGTLLLTSGIPPASSGWGAASTLDSLPRGTSALPSYLLLLGIPLGIILLWRARKRHMPFSR